MAATDVPNHYRLVTTWSLKQALLSHDLAVSSRSGNTSSDGDGSTVAEVQGRQESCRSCGVCAWSQSSHHTSSVVVAANFGHTAKIGGMCRGKNYRKAAKMLCVVLQLGPYTCRVA